MVRRTAITLTALLCLLPACATDLDTDSSEASASEPLLGVWEVTGKDARGKYSGKIELRKATGANGASAVPNKIEFIRVVRYDKSVTVEGGRELWTAWTGSGTAEGSDANVSVDLLRADFVKSRGGVTRTEADKRALTLKGNVHFGDGGARLRWSADGLTVDETLTKRAASAAEPIFRTERSSTPAHDPPGFVTKTIIRAFCPSYAKLPAVAPYANDPRFKEGMTYIEVDKTDFAFYREHPNALRVVNKVVDAPSLGETLAQANAYRKTLADKAAVFDEEMPRLFVEPATGQVVHGRIKGVQEPTGDGALWTATYIASQAYRYMVTKDPVAIENVVRSAEGQQLLLEIVPDQRTFARTLRGATGKAEPGWHRGTGPFAAYEWLEGGNNDMFKGLFYGTLMAYATLCDPVLPGQAELCSRMQRNAAHIKDLTMAGDPGSRNHLLATWLSYYVNGTDGAAAASDFASQDFSIENRGFQISEGATADWSGTHLTFVNFNGLLFLSSKKPLVGKNGATLEVEKATTRGIKKMRDDFTRFRMGIWSVLFSTPSIVGTVAKADVDNMKWRLYEVPAPRAALDIDHRVSASFCMSPYPSVPWKNDCSVNDRTNSLNGYPLFEQPLNVYNWRSGPYDYAGNQSDWESPSFDYLHAYWLARYLRVLDAKE
jgi:hypothetical protein